MGKKNKKKVSLLRVIEGPKGRVRIKGKKRVKLLATRVLVKKAGMNTGIDSGGYQCC